MMRGGGRDRCLRTKASGAPARPGGLLHHLFGVRTRGLMGEIEPRASASYLSGILIGHEIRAQRASVSACSASRSSRRCTGSSRVLGISARVLDPGSGGARAVPAGAMLR